MTDRNDEPLEEAAIERYGEQRDEMLEYVADASNRNYPIEATAWTHHHLVGIEVILTNDRLAHYGTLQDMARGAVDDWFLRDVEPIGDRKVRYEFSIDTDRSEISLD